MLSALSFRFSLTFTESYHFVGTILTALATNYKLWQNPEPEPSHRQMKTLTNGKYWKIYQYHHYPYIMKIYVRPPLIKSIC